MLESQEEDNMYTARRKEWFILGFLLIYIGIVPVMSEDYVASWSKTFGGPYQF
jgi:nitrate reductase NapE component